MIPGLKEPGFFIVSEGVALANRPVLLTFFLILFFICDNLAEPIQAITEEIDTMERSQAQDARKYDPYGCSLSIGRAAAYWRESTFINGRHETVQAQTVRLRHGVLSVIFPDGSIINW